MAGNRIHSSQYGLIIVFVFTLLLAAHVRADEQAGALRGTVVDPTGAPIPGAMVRAWALGGGEGKTVTAGPGGQFGLPLGPGEYQVQAEADGFEARSVLVRAPEAFQDPLRITLAVARKYEMVTVVEKAGYRVPEIASALKTPAPLRDVPQSVTVISRDLIQDQMMTGIADAVRYIPGLTAQQGENNRDQLTIRGNTSTADFFVNGVRDDVQYFRDVYNLERIEALKGPNAMIFGRGGGGGVVNRVTKEPAGAPMGEVTLAGGWFGHKRAATDVNQPLGEKVAVRLNGMFEDSGSFRDEVTMRRYAVNPALALRPSEALRAVLSYERLRDDRVGDRGIPSYQGRPASMPIATFFGDPSQSHAGARVHLGSALLEWQRNGIVVRNRTLVGDYDRGYQNYVPGAVTADRSSVAISAYNSSTHRRNVFNQTDLAAPVVAAGMRHWLLAGFEAGRQRTWNLRHTGYFHGTETSVSAPLLNPLVTTPVVFRQSATDANNRVASRVTAVYVQDQVDLTRRLRAVAGIRLESFDLKHNNRRNGEVLGRRDHLVSPRAGLVYRPWTPVSVYANLSVSYLPSSGDQFAALTSVTQQMKPEQFTSYEAGVKWDLARGLMLTGAAYRLDRTNTRAVDPNDPGRILQTGSERSNGFELGWNGAIRSNWSVAGGYAWQDAYVRTDTAAAKAGRKAAQAPRHSFSLWNHYQVHPRAGVALGLVSRSAMFAAIDNAVTLPGYATAEGALFVSLRENVRLQVNVDNLTGRTYYVNAHNNNNISPGRPRSARAGLTVRF